MHLTGLLSAEVRTVTPREAPDHSTRMQQLIDSGLLFGSIKVPGVSEQIVLSANLLAETVSASIVVQASRDGRLTTRVNQLVRQLGEADAGLRVEASYLGVRTTTTKLLGEVREKPASLILDDREFRSFRLSLDLPMGRKRGRGRGSLIGSVVEVVDVFYADVVQHLRPRPPQLSPSA